MKLTPKQEKFCLEFVKTGNASEAYRRAYSTEKMKDETIWTKASKLLARDKVRARVEEIKQKAEDEAILSIKQRKELLTQIAKESPPNEAVKAIDILNKMDAVYLKKVEHKGTIPVEIVIE